MFSSTAGWQHTGLHEQAGSWGKSVFLPFTWCLFLPGAVSSLGPACSSLTCSCQDGQGDWGTGPVRKGWGKWGYSAWHTGLWGGVGSNSSLSVCERRLLGWLFHGLDWSSWSKNETSHIGWDGRFSVKVIEDLGSMGTVKHGNGLRGAAQSLSYEVLRLQCDKTLSSFSELSIGAALAGAWHGVLLWEPLCSAEIKLAEGVKWHDAHTVPCWSDLLSDGPS